MTATELLVARSLRFAHIEVLLVLQERLQVLRQRIKRLRNDDFRIVRDLHTFWQPNLAALHLDHKLDSLLVGQFPSFLLAAISLDHE